MSFPDLLHRMAELARLPMKGLLLVGGTLLCTSGLLARPPQPSVGERLSDWLLRQPSSYEAFPSGLFWQVPKEQVQQSFTQNQLLLQIQLAKGVTSEHRHSLAQVVRSLPVTGRVSIPIADARWLQAHPKADPFIGPGDRLALPKRPRSVTMLRQDGSWCTAPHQPGFYALDYIRRCDPEHVMRIDRAWVVQPNGVVQINNVADWNVQSQDEIGPGGLLWAPTRDTGWSERVSSLLMEFLATQPYESIITASERSNHLARASLRIDKDNFTPSGAPRGALLTSNDWGMLGIWQTPSARFAQAGEARFNYTQAHPYKRYNVFLQPFDWLEVGFRYTDIVNRLYGSAELSGDQTYKDKSIDYRIRLKEETVALPQLTLGMIDFGGTGLFSSEFIVASKRVGDFDWSLGIGWGNMGASGNIRNPLEIVSKKANTRGVTSSEGGEPNVATYFRGPAAIFGGFQYHTPWDNWVLKAEYDGNNYRNEPLSNPQAQRIPVNVGVVYRPHPSLDLSLALQRGDTFMVGFTLQTSLAKLYAPKVSDQPTPRIERARPVTEKLWVGTPADLYAMSGWGIKRITQIDRSLRVVFDGFGGVHWNDRIERIIAVLHRDAPASVDEFELTFEEQGVALTQRLIVRETWAEQNTSFVVGADSRPYLTPREPIEASMSLEKPLWEATPPRFGYALVPSWQQNIGGPNSFVLFRVGLATPFRFRIKENLLVSGAVSLNVFDNYDKFTYDGPSLLPRVRTNLRQYSTESRLNLPNLQITKFGEASKNNFYSVYAGYLEPMFGGIGAEWLYRPWHKSLAFGVDINFVQQRNFDQFFGFNDAGSQTGYRVATGHATAYWDTGWYNTHARVSFGRYLAGDIGATLDMSRTFENGVTVGAWLTRTDVSATRFGEGSFDKGMYLRIPFDVMTTTRSGDAANLVYNPLTRDGGARLNRNFTLYGATQARSLRDTGYFPAN